uniref:ULP_PROTEASE domain-containing protein n=1 Tax=Bursaphelenchus xylophilus TaxID=6326 RepID=A0A1I7SW50_BURXY
MKRDLSISSGSSTKTSEFSSTKASRRLVTNALTNSIAPLPNGPHRLKGSGPSDSQSKELSSIHSEEEVDQENYGQTSFLSLKSRSKLSVKEGVPIRRTGSTYESSCVDQSDSKSSIDVPQIPPQIAENALGKTLICHLIKPITILSHQKIRLKPHKRLLTMSNHFFITSTASNVPPKFDDRVIRMKNSRKLMRNSFVPLDNHIPIGRVSQKIFADSQMTYMEVKVGVNMDESANEYEFKDARSFKNLFHATFKDSERGVKYQPVDLLVALSLTRRGDGLVTIKEKITFKFNFSAGNKPYLQVLEPYIQAMFHPQEDNISSPYFYDEFVTVGHDVIEISRKTEVPGVGKIKDFEKVLDLGESFELQEDRIYSQNSRDMSKVLNSIHFKNLSVRNKRALKHGASVTNVRTDRSEAQFLKSEKSKSTVNVFSPKLRTVHANHPKPSKSAANIGDIHAINVRKLKKKSPMVKKNIEKIEARGFAIADILKEVSSESSGFDIIKPKETFTDRMEECIKNDYGIRETGKAMTDNTMEEVSSLQEDKTLSPLVSQEDIKKKGRKMKKKNKSGMEENGGVSVDEMAYFKALGQAVAIPSGAPADARKKKRKSRSKAATSGTRSNDGLVTHTAKERTVKKKRNKKEVSLNADVQRVPVKLNMSVEVNQKGKTANIKDVELWMGEKCVFDSDKNM